METEATSKPKRKQTLKEKIDEPSVFEEPPMGVAYWLVVAPGWKGGTEAVAPH